MDYDLSDPGANPDSQKMSKDAGTVSENHAAHLNGMSNGFEKKESKSEHRDKERSHKSEHKDKERSKDKSHRHSSSSKDKHSSSSRDKDKDKKSSSSSSSKDKDHKSSSSSSKDKDRKDKDRDHKHKSSSSSSKDKDKHHSSSSKDKDKESSSKDKDKKSSSSSRDKDHKSSSSSSKDKDRKDKDRDHKHKSSSSSSKDKDRHHSSSSKDKERSRDKDKDRKHDKEKSKHRDEKEKKEKVKEEPVIKQEPNEEANDVELKVKVEVKMEVKDEPISNNYQDDDYDSSEEQRLYIKEESEDYEVKEENNLESTGNSTRLSDLHNTTVKTEDSDDEDMPLASRAVGKKRKTVSSSDDEEDVPLLARKKSKAESKKKKKKRPMDSEDEEDEEYVKPKKKAAKTTKKENASPTKSPKKKKEEEQDVWKWWEEEKKEDGVKWNFLEHKGPVFAPEYEPLPNNVNFWYDKQKMKLSKAAEEVATFYARMIEHEYTQKKVFNDNFFKDWVSVMNHSEKAKITDLSKCDFKEIHAYFVQKSEERKAMSKEEKKALKEENEELMKEYGFCKIDGHKEKIGNFKIEPPGLFRGRGEHPKMGRLKKRVLPSEVSINCSKDSVWPKPPEGTKWKEVKHDNTVTWLASWTENVQGQVKYVMLNPSSKLKGEKDWQKYETARKLAKRIDDIRSNYIQDWKSKEMKVRQLAVALYFIDKLALRAGNEKDEDQADTVGCCSLRVEHITLHEKKDDKQYVVVFDFLGKDSIRYYNEVPVEKRVYKNLLIFMEGKQPGDDLFDRLNTSIMNKHLNYLMPELTAKVFRTYNASITLQQQLNELTKEDYSVAEKILAYNRANRKVAILCNHQRAVPKTHAKSMENLKSKIIDKKDKIEECEREVKEAKKMRDSATLEKKKKQLQRLKEQLDKLEVQATDREENKEIALGTSKLNYLDPRISVAWCKKHEVPIEKIYNKTQRDKFRWAIDMAGPDYVF